MVQRFGVGKRNQGTSPLVSDIRMAYEAHQGLIHEYAGLFKQRLLLSKPNYDVICEKGPYCGRNIVGPDQMPRMMRGV